MEPGTKKLRLRRETPLTASRRRVPAALRAIAQRSRNPRASGLPPEIRYFPICIFVPSRLSVNSAFPRSEFRVPRCPSRVPVALTQTIGFQRQSWLVAASRGWGRSRDCRSLRMALSPLTRTRLRLCESLRLRVKIRARKLKKFAELLFCVLYVRLRLPQSATCLGIANAPDFTTE
jgi:hypothetical protein